MKNRKFRLFLSIFLLTALFCPLCAPAAQAWQQPLTAPYRPSNNRVYYYTRLLPFLKTEETKSPETKPEVTHPVQGSQPSVSAAASAERQMLAWINEDRAAQGLAPLTLHEGLSQEAERHSQDMMQGKYCSHTSPTRGGFAQRLSASGIRTQGAGENVARYGSLEKAHAALMSSPSHRANLMNERYTHIGLGITRDAGGVYYITQWTARMP